MRFANVDNAFEVCSKYLQANNARGTEIETYFTNYMLILIYATFENKFHQLIGKRARKANDQHLVSYIENTSDRILQSIYVSDLTGLLGKWDATMKDNFQHRVRDTKAQQMYDLIVGQRHHAAHGSGNVTMTFKDLVAAYRACLLIPDRFAEVLGVPEEVT